MESSRKGREAIKSEPVTLRRDYYMDCNPIFGMNNSSHILGAHPWSLTQGRWAHLTGWRASETNKRDVGNLDSTHEKHVHTYLLQKQGREGGLKTVPVAGWLLMTAPVHVPAWAEQTLQPHFFHKATPHWDEDPAVRHRGSSDPKQHLNRAWATITGTYMSSTSEGVWVSEPRQTAPAVPWSMATAHTSPSCSSSAPFWGKGTSAGRGRAHT